MGRRRRPIIEEERKGAKNGGSTKLSVVRGGHKIDLGRRSPWWSGGRMEHQCVAGANNIKQTAWWWSAHNNIREEVSFLLAFFNNTKQETMRQLGFARGGLGGV